MRCHICNAEDDTISRDFHERGGWSSCRTCQAITFDCIGSDDDDDTFQEETDYGDFTY